MILFEYKGVQVKGESRDDLELLGKPLKIVELLAAELKKQIDLRIYNERAKEIMTDYLTVEDYAEIIGVLAKEEETLTNP
jgi:hypothetical protein